MQWSVRSVVADRDVRPTRQFEIHIKDFASPYGSVNDKVLQQIHLWYQSHRSADVGLNTASEFDAYNIMCVTIDREEGTTLANIKRWIDQAIKTKTWLVLAFHQVDGPGEKYYENGDPYNATPEFLQQILSYVAAHPQTRPVTIDQGLSEVYQQV